MAKISFNKLNLKNNIEKQTLVWNDQEIEIIQLLPMDKKLDLISNIINLSVDDNGYYNHAKLEVFTNLEIIKAYTNIKFTDKQEEQPYKLFDLMYFEGFFDSVFEKIPEEELDFIKRVSKQTIKSIYAYHNSAAAMLDTMSQDFSETSFNVEEIYNKLKDPENLELVRNIVTKVG